MKRVLLGIATVVALTACGPRAAPAATPAVTATPPPCTACTSTGDTVTATNDGWVLRAVVGHGSASLTLTAPTGTQVRGFCGGSAFVPTVTDVATGKLVPQQPRMEPQYCMQGGASSATGDVDIPTIPGTYVVSGSVSLEKGGSVTLPVRLSIIVA